LPRIGTVGGPFTAVGKRKDEVLIHRLLTRWKPGVSLSDKQDEINNREAGKQG
jgi:hypothetical protein